MNEGRICEITSTECLYERCDKCPIENHEIQLVPLDKVLEIIERLNRNGSVSVKLLRKELEVLKGGEQK